MASADRPENQSNRAQEGALISDRFEVLEKIGEGGMGSVFKARQIATGRTIAIKFLSDQSLEDDVRRARFEQEARAASLLYHPNLVSIIDFGCDEKMGPYLALEYIPGVGLDQMLKKKGRLDAHELTEIFSQVCKGVSHVHHKGIVHRDLKPSNVMVFTDESGELQVKIVDFGIAKQQRPQAITQTGELIGSPLYMSPEQAMGSSVDARSDIYSVGCMLFEAATGRAPFIGENAIASLVKRLNHDPPTFEQVAPFAGLSSELERVVMRALKRDPDERYQTIAALQADLREIGTVHPKPTGTLQNLRTLRSQSVEGQDATVLIKPARMNRGALIGAVCVIGLLSAGASYWWSQSNAKTPAVAVVAAKPNMPPPVVAQAAPPKPVPVPKPIAKAEVEQKHAPMKAKIVPLPEDIQADLDERKAAREQPQIRYVYVNANPAQSTTAPAVAMLPPPQPQIQIWQRHFAELMTQANDQRSHNDFGGAAMTYQEAIDVLRAHGAERTEEGANAHNRRGECFAAMRRSSEAAQEYGVANRINGAL